MEMQEFACAYMDDIIIYSNTWDEHVTHTNTVLERLATLGLTAKHTKCEWPKARCLYLGHKVGGGRVAPDDCKVEAVQQFLQPTTKTGVWSFLGLAGFYRRFVHHFADHSIHLTKVTGKTAPQKLFWTTELESEFQYLKQALSTAPVFTIPTKHDNLQLYADASDVGVGAVLSMLRYGDDTPVGYILRKLLPRELRYATTEKECLAIVEAIRHFAIYLIERLFLPGLSRADALELGKTQSGMMGTSITVIHLHSSA